MLESSSLLEKNDGLVVLKVLLGDFIQSEECEKSFINTSNIPELGLQLTSNYIHFSRNYLVHPVYYILVSH